MLVDDLDLPADANDLGKAGRLKSDLGTRLKQGVEFHQPETQGLLGAVKKAGAPTLVSGRVVRENDLALQHGVQAVGCFGGRYPLGGKHLAGDAVNGFRVR
jgi:hypothetical protein